MQDFMIYIYFVLPVILNLILQIISVFSYRHFKKDYLFGHGKVIFGYKIGDGDWKDEASLNPFITCGLSFVITSYLTLISLLFTTTNFEAHKFDIICIVLALALEAITIYIFRTPKWLILTGGAASGVILVLALRILGISYIPFYVLNPLPFLNPYLGELDSLALFYTVSFIGALGIRGLLKWTRLWAWVWTCEGKIKRVFFK